MSEVLQNLENVSCPTTKAKHKPHPVYCNSGIEWLGKVPEGWEIKRLKFIAVLLNGYAFDSKDYTDNGIPIIRIGDVGGEIDCEKVKRVSEHFLKALTRFRIYNGDILLALTGATIGKTSVYQSDTVSLLNQRVGIIRAVKLNQKFLEYCVVSETFSEMINYLCYGGAQENIGKDEIANIAVTKPPLEDQKPIANFLDEKTAKIDALVEKKQRLIELLKEKRTALISHAVTKGLDSNAKMKDSGVEWLGAVPETWEVRKLKDFGRLVGGAGFPHEYQNVQGEELYFYKVGDLKLSDNGKTLLTSPHTISRSTACFLRATIIPVNSVVYAKIGAALLLNRRRLTTAPCCIDNNMTAYIPITQHILSEWAFYWLCTIDFGEHTNSGAVPSLSEGYQSVLPILAPSIPEQREIVEHLDQETAKLDALIEKVRIAIDKLKEYRTALISAAVTGKIDVRGYEKNEVQS